MTAIIDGTLGITLPTGAATVLSGTGAPTGVTAAKGSIYTNITATSTITRLYVNTDGATTWASVTTSA